MKKCNSCNTVCFDGAAFCPSCGHDLKGASVLCAGADPYTGMVVGEKYLLLERIGEGGMGVVYKAEQTFLGKSVAVKILHPHLINDSNAVSRFRAEAKAASRLNHPNSISVIDFGETEGGLFYLTTEFLRGKPLADIMDSTPRLEISFIMTVMCQVLSAMDEAHTLGIIHRDLKPDNIFVEPLGEGGVVAKVLDFGIAKSLDSKDRGLTTPGMVCGTPDYMAPEQAKGLPVDKRADIYALGVLLYEMLTGVNPYQRESSAETMVAHVDFNPRPPSVQLKDREIPESLDTIVMWALAKKADERFESAGRFLDVLEDWCEIYLKTERRERAQSEEYDSVVISPEKAALLLDPESEAISGAYRTSIDHDADSMPGDPDVRIRIETSDTLAADVNFSEIEGIFESPETKRVRKPGTVSPEGAFLVGRDDALQKAEKALLKGLPVELVGEAGIGKTSLMEAVLNILKTKGIQVVAVDSPVNPRRVAPLAPIRDVVKALLQVDEETQITANLFNSILKQAGIRRAETMGMRELMGVIDPKGEAADFDLRIRERRTAWVNLVKKSAEAGPLVLAFDDVDLYDEPSIELLDHLADAVARGTVTGVSILTTRDTARPSELSERMEQIQLSGLTTDEVLTLSNQWLAYFSAQREIPTTRKLHVAGGNPFFVEQLTRAVFDGGIPPSISRRIDLLDWRFERLRGLPRQVLQLAAIWGGPFNAEDILEGLLRMENKGNTTSQLKAVSNVERKGEAETSGHEELVLNVLHDLNRRGFVKYRNQRWQVAHRLIEQTVEAGTPAEVRHEYHAVCLERIHRSRQFTTVWPHSAAVRLAEHAIAAGRSSEAADALLIAGAEFFRAGAPERAVGYWHRAVDLMRRFWAAGGVGDHGITADLVSAMRMLAQAMNQKGEKGAASAILREALTLLHDRRPGLKASILLDLGKMDLESGRPDLALEELQKAHGETSSSEKHLWWLRAEIALELGRILARRGDLEQAVELLADGLSETAEHHGPRNEHAWNLSLLIAEIYSGWSRFEQAEDFIRNALMKAEEAGSISGECVSRIAMARLMERKGSLINATDHLYSAYGLAGEYGDRHRCADLALRLAGLYKKAGDSDSQALWLSTAARHAREINDYRILSEAEKGMAAT